MSPRHAQPDPSSGQPSPGADLPGHRHARPEPPQEPADAQVGVPAAGGPGEHGGDGSQPPAAIEAPPELEVGADAATRPEAQLQPGPQRGVEIAPEPWPHAAYSDVQPPAGAPAGRPWPDPPGGWTLGVSGSDPPEQPQARSSPTADPALGGPPILVEPGADPVNPFEQPSAASVAARAWPADGEPAVPKITGGGRRPRRLLLLGLLLVLGVALVALVVASLNGSGGSGQGTATTPSPSPSQGTLLIQVRNNADLGADNMIAGVGGGLAPAQVLAPSRLMVDVPGAGQMTLGRSAQQLDRSASQDSLSDLLSLRVDGTLSLGRLALAGMVDYVGGIVLTIGQEVTEEDPKTGDQVVVVPQGTAHLNGTQAATYALAWLPEEPEAARLARFSDVMTATISSLPDDPLRVEAMLTSLGGQARTTTTTSAVADFLVEMRAAILAGGQQVRVLPVTDIEAAGATPVVRVDIQAADAMLESLLPQAVLADSQSQPRVLVQNGVGTPGLGASARDKLVAEDLVYINGGNADSFGHKHTAILVRDDSAAAQEDGAAVAEALGLPVSAIEIAASGQNVADVVVILGSDFKA